ncbi:MAG: DUF5063 domain-containing protein [Chloroflexota bacterium]
MTLSRDAGTQQEIVQHFADEATEFCELIEDPSALTSVQFVHKSADLLVTLYQVGLALPELDAADEIVAQQVTLKPDAHLYPQVAEKLGKHNTYWQLPDPYDHGVPTAGDLAEDLTEIYSELKTGLLAFNKGAEEDILLSIWHWKFFFMVHWGGHTVDALRALHALIANNLMSDQHL